MTLFFTPSIQEKQDEKIVLDNNLNTYKNENFGFSVEYPANWKTKEEETWESNEEYEGSPDGGINIYVGNDESEKIYIFGQCGHISLGNSETKRNKFVANNGVEGTLVIEEINDRYEIYLILGEGFHGAILDLSKQCFDENKELIINILKSINIL